MMMALGITGLMLGMVTQGLRWTLNRLTVVNRSGQPISQVKIAVTGSSSVVLFEDVPDRGDVSSTFAIGSDGQFRVSGTLADGTSLKGDFGYVTHGMYGEQARFLVKPGGEIDFFQGK